MREKVVAALGMAIAALPDDLGALLRVAFALDPAARLPFYGNRVDLAADRMGRDRRTVRRRVDEGITHLAEVLDDRTAGEDPPSPAAVPRADWYTRELRTFVNLDLPVPEAFEIRRVVAERDGLRTLDLAFTVTASPDRPGIDLFSGGRLLGTRQQAADRTGFALELPVTLAKGDEHVFVVRFRAEAGAGVKPHYVCVPKQRCDRFDLRVRFATGRIPPEIWLLSGGFQRDLDDPVATGEPAEPDSTGEVHAEFGGLMPGLTYGFRWSEG
ncbi:hypothetical protein [Amycolatopsis sp. YIM 10]|uniref:hypothetical protein n=1 Tax=Amycolatopsis sp. YIM 10 TaxID=2653857 RepID=UPI001D13E947|nr:hypothetical protein [Amycolatopsis sp. YIM 10]